MVDVAAVNLLWHSEESKKMYADSKEDLDQTYIKNLGVEQVVKSICQHDKYLYDIRKLVCYMSDDPKVIQYRLDVLEDFIRLPELAKGLTSLLPSIHRLENEQTDLHSLGADQFRKITWQLEKLYIYRQCVEQLSSILFRYRSEMKSEGLLRLHAYFEEVTKDETYQSLSTEIPALIEEIQNISHITIGINLSPTLKPEAAVVLSVEPRPHKGKSLLSKLLGLKSAEEKYDNLSQYQRLVNKSVFGEQLLKQLGEIFEEALIPIGATIRRYRNINSEPIIELALAISFYSGATKWIKKLESEGLTMCKPAVLPKEDRAFQVSDLRDMILAMNGIHFVSDLSLDERVVGNDVEFGPDGRILVVTGPNQGGKTTYTRSIGLAQLLFQAGLYIPGSSAAISPADWICTHFNEEETPNVDDGRLGEESRRLAEVFERATEYSLILLNESFSSTSPGEALYLTKDIIKGIILVEARGVLVTHFHELAAQIDQINSEFPDNDTRLISMVAGVENDDDDPSTHKKRTYKVIPSPPQGLSYAQDIARMYGISLEQIKEKLSNRGIL